MMFNIISKSLVKQSSSLVNLATKTSTFCCWRHSQAYKKPIRFDHVYGEPPYFNQDLYLEAKESGELDRMEYETIRFTILSENDSVFYDPDFAKFSTLVMKGGRKDLAYKLMSDTFYEIKIIQLRKLRKKQAKLEANKDDQTNSGALTIEQLNDNENIIETNPYTIFKQAIKNAEPTVITKAVTRGGATYQVPYPVSAGHSKLLAARWLLEAVKERPKPRTRRFKEAMAQELIDAYLNQGKVIKRRDDMHRLADANKAYAHYRWG